MTSRSLELIAPDLAQRVAAAPPRLLRRLAIESARLALSRTLLTEPRLEGALRELEIYGGVRRRTLLEIKRIVESLDDRYFQLHEAAERSKEGDRAWVHAFEKARAANAVYSALVADPFEAASEALYETHAAVGERPNEIRALISKILEIH